MELIRPWFLDFYKEARMSSISPSVGRKVWLWAGEDSGLSIVDKAQACDATILLVLEDGSVNLAVCDHNGNQTTAFGVPLSDPDVAGTPPDVHHWEGSGDQIYATWMPYQVAQAKASAPPAAKK